MEGLLYFILAALGLGFLIFIHELGHYFVARRVGMRVEVFSIGFGRPIYSKMRDGVKWQIGWLPLGGYVRFAGMEKEGNLEPSQITDGFFGKRPLDRMKVAFAGPLVNILFALAIFTLIWGCGGREKSFSQFTNRVGWVDETSQLYEKGVRPGDEITAYDGHALHSFKDHLYAALLAGEKVAVKGNQINYFEGKETPFTFSVEPYPHPDYFGMDLLTTGVVAPAAYLFYGSKHIPESGSLLGGSPMEGSGLELGDRLFWVDGSLLFSLSQLDQILNEKKALLTVKRGDTHVLRRVPRLSLTEFKLRSDQREELIDWSYEVGKNGLYSELKFIPYDLTLSCVVEGTLPFIDADDEKIAFPSRSFSEIDEMLEVGDKIIAIDGKPISKAYDLLREVQAHDVLILVQRNSQIQGLEPSLQANLDFDKDINWEHVKELIASIGLSSSLQELGEFSLLKPVQPKRHIDFEMTEEEKAQLVELQQERLRRIEAIIDPEQKQEMLQLFQEHKERLILGIQGIRNKPVLYNPGPFALTWNVLEETFRTLKSLVTGNLSPKWLSGPVGIVQVMHHSWSVGILEGLFWLGTISLSLGILNLFPIPVLDGGYIVLSLIEMITGKPFKTRTIERLILPFVVFIILVFVFLTYHDLSRLLTQIF
jgi:regulator of sigma E protease